MDTVFDWIGFDIETGDIIDVFGKREQRKGVEAAAAAQRDLGRFQAQADVQKTRLLIAGVAVMVFGVFLWRATR